MPLLVDFSATAKGDPKVSEYNFSLDFGDGSPPFLRSVNVTPGVDGVVTTNHTYAQVGTFFPSVTVNDGVDTTGGATTTIDVTTPLTVSAVALPPAVTSGRPVVLEANASGGSPPYNYVWSGVPSGCVVGTANLTCTVKMVGTYTVRVDVSDSVLSSATTSISFLVNPKIVASATYTSWYHCVGTVDYLTDNFTGTAKGGTPPYLYSWNFGDGSANISGANASHNYTQATVYTVSFTVGDASGAVANKTFSISTNFIACEPAPPFTSLVTPELVGGVIVAAVAVSLLAMVYWRSRHRPEKKPAPLPAWKETETPAADSPHASSGPPPHDEGEGGSDSPWSP